MRLNLKTSLSIQSISFAAALAMALTPQMAQAQDGHKGAYVNLGAALLSADLDLSNIDVQGNAVDLGEESADIIMLNGRIGYRFNAYIAAEVEGGFGLGGDSASRDNVPIPVAGFGTVPVNLDANVDINTYGAVFARAVLPVNQSLDLFIRGGYGTASADADVTATTDILGGISVSDSLSDSIDGFAFGAGAEYHLTEKHGLRLDVSAINSDVQFFAASYSYKF